MQTALEYLLEAIEEYCASKAGLITMEHVRHIVERAIELQNQDDLGPEPGPNP